MTQIINYTIDELKSMAKNSAQTPLFNGKYAFEILDPIALDGEIFRQVRYRYNPKIILEASNYGRIRLNKKILPQHEKDKNSHGYLVVDVPNIYPILVYQLVADAWLEKQSDNDEIHHIYNDGYDNRPQNLIFISKFEHNKIHK